MLKLVSNKNGVEVHQLTISDNEISITPAFNGITELLSGITDKQQILNALSQFNPDYVWAVTHETPPTPVLTRRQFRLALIMNGFALADIEALINQIEDGTQRQITLIEWQDGAAFERYSPSLLKMAELMNLSSPQVDELWSQALTL